MDKATELARVTKLALDALNSRITDIEARAIATRLMLDAVIQASPNPRIRGILDRLEATLERIPELAVDNPEVRQKSVATARELLAAYRRSLASPEDT